MANNIIKMNRGDTYEFNLTVDAGDGNNYILKDNDTVYFGLMEPNAPFEFSLVKKMWTKDDQDKNGNFIVSINPEDTVHLLPGVYYYSIKLEMNHQDVDANNTVYKVITVINKTKFIILD